MSAVKALSPFVHGSYNLNAGDTVPNMPDAVAKDLEGAGLLEITGESVEPEEKAAPTPSNKKAAEPKNKAA